MNQETYNYWLMILISALWSIFVLLSMIYLKPDPTNKNTIIFEALLLIPMFFINSVLRIEND